jgi:hypothetical protein
VSSRQLGINWGRTGATLYYRVLDRANNALVARTSTGVSESPSGSGLYVATVAAWNDGWSGRVVWDDGTLFAAAKFGGSPAFQAVDWGISGLPLAYRVVGADGSTLVARTTTGVTEYPAGSGLYTVTVPGWDQAWLGRVIWDDGTYFAAAGVDGTTLRNILGYLVSQAGDVAAANEMIAGADAIETGVSLRQAVQRMNAVLAGKVLGAGTGTEEFLAPDGTTVRVRVTTDASGNRLTVVFDPT